MLQARQKDREEVETGERNRRRVEKSVMFCHFLAGSMIVSGGVRLVGAISAGGVPDEGWSPTLMVFLTTAQIAGGIWWFAWGAKRTANAPEFLQQKIDALEAEIAHQKIVEQAEEQRL